MGGGHEYTSVEDAPTDVSRVDFETVYTVTLRASSGTRFPAMQPSPGLAYRRSNNAYEIVSIRDDLAYVIRVPKTGVCKAVVSKSSKDSDWLIIVSFANGLVEVHSCELVHGLICETPDQ